MSDDFYKFPSTPHLAILGDREVRGDKVMPAAERDEFLGHELVVEEKVDGANLGISFDAAGNIRVQNRGDYLRYPYSGQWKRLRGWLDQRTDLLFERLTDRLILFGEWCYAKHSIYYDRLPDWYLGFDVYDKVAARYFSCSRRDALLEQMGVFVVPRTARGRFSFRQVIGLLSHPHFADGPAEGLYLRFENGDWLQQRSKLVRAEFLETTTSHWSRAPIEPNRLRPDGAR